MKANFALLVTLANTALAGPLAYRDAASDLTALTSAVKVHTANIKLRPGKATYILEPKANELWPTFLTDTTLATLPNATTIASTSPNNSSATANISAEFNLIAQALNSSSETVGNTKRSLPLFGRQTEAACDATCQEAAYNDLGALTSEIAYTMEACINKNAVDLTSASSVLITVVKTLSDLTSSLEDSVVGVGGIVVQTLQAAMGTEIGGALASFIS